jgi:signal transduction histidine kinase
MRLPIRFMPREILPLIEAINGALDRLDDALEAQRRFTADAAHELLTPLAVLRAQIETLDEADACALRRDIDAMTDIVRQLLLLSELDSLGDAMGAGKVTDLHAIALEVVALLAPLAGSECKDIELTGGGGPIMVKGPPSVLGRALRNLVENAVRHTPTGTRVTVELDSGGRVAVIDHGPGVPPDKRHVIFERFWRAERDDEGGAGLGLAIVKRILDLVGGSIRVEDAAGGGARFVMELLRADAPADASPAKADPGGRPVGDPAA